MLQTCVPTVHLPSQRIVVRLRREAVRQSSLPFALALLFALTTITGAQVTPGMPAFSAYDSHEVDTINLQNLNIVLTVPVVSKPGAFPFSYSLIGNYYMYTSGSDWAASLQVNGQLPYGLIGGGYASAVNILCPEWHRSASINSLFCHAKRRGDRVFR